MPITDDIRRLELAQLNMTAGLFSVLDNILSSIAPPPVPEIKAGGYPEEIFVSLTEEDKNDFECSICYMILKEAQQCKNKHKFCSSCILAWTRTSTSQGADKCPVCRTEGDYQPCDILNARLSYRRTKCPQKDCDWSGFLKDFESHQHNTYNAEIAPRPNKSLPALEGAQRSLPPIAGTIRPPNHPTLNRSTEHGTTHEEPRNSTDMTPENDNRSNSSSQGATRRNNQVRPNRTENNRGPTNRSGTTSGSVSGSRQQQGPAVSRPAPVTSGSVRRASTGSNANSNGATASAQNRSIQVPRRHTLGPSDSRVTGSQINTSFLGRRSSLTPNRLSNVAQSDSQQPAASAASSPRSVAESQTDSRPRLPPISPSSLQNDRTYRNHHFAQMAAQIREGRSQLHDIMAILGGELELRRNSIQEYRQLQERQQRERLRQLQEVHTLGRRLGEVASNLATLMNGLGRRQSGQGSFGSGSNEHHD